MSTTTMGVNPRTGFGTTLRRRSTSPLGIPTRRVPRHRSSDRRATSPRQRTVVPKRRDPWPCRTLVAIHLVSRPLGSNVLDVSKWRVFPVHRVSYVAMVLPPGRDRPLGSLPPRDIGTREASPRAAPSERKASRVRPYACARRSPDERSIVVCDGAPFADVVAFLRGKRMARDPARERWRNVAQAVVPNAAIGRTNRAWRERGQAHGNASPGLCIRHGVHRVCTGAFRA